MKGAKLYIDAFDGIFDQVDNMVKSLVKKVTRLFK
jgi:hypothetical protein